MSVLDLITKLSTEMPGYLNLISLSISQTESELQKINMPFVVVLHVQESDFLSSDERNSFDIPSTHRAFAREDLVWMRWNNEFRIVYRRSIWVTDFYDHQQIASCSKFADGVSIEKPLIEVSDEKRIELTPFLNQLVQKLYETAKDKIPQAV
jgi:hypothetical protein